MKKILLLSAVVMLLASQARSQGCVVVRGLSGFGQYNPVDRSFSTSDWLINMNNRYFKSFRNYMGHDDQHVQPAGAAVNSVFSTDFAISRMFKKGWSLSLDLPITANSRTSSVEHGGAGTKNFTTHSFGLGDISLVVYKWLIKPTPQQKGNIQLGLGIKLPTGSYNYSDYFYKNDSTRILAPVNLSIQLGDGGTGIITELNSYYFLTKNLEFYANGYYLINPRNVNGVSTLLGATPTRLQTWVGADVASVPDQYSLRAGFEYVMKQLVFSAGLRDEGIPVYDLIGQSDGVRRPGHNLSVEPGITYNMKTVSIYFYMPFFVQHVILESVPDKKLNAITGGTKYGTGGSGDWMIFLGFMVKI